MKRLFFSRAKYTFPNLPLPKGRPISKLSIVKGFLIRKAKVGGGGRGTWRLAGSVLAGSLTFLRWLIYHYPCSPYAPSTPTPSPFLPHHRSSSPTCSGILAKQWSPDSCSQPTSGQGRLRREQLCRVSFDIPSLYPLPIVPGTYGLAVGPVHEGKCRCPGGLLP